MKRITLEKLLQSHAERPYHEQYSYVMKLLESGRIKPVKATGTNGKAPALYREYWLEDKTKDYSHLEEELKYRLVPLLSIDYYLAHLHIYEQERESVLYLNEYLKDKKERLRYQESANERSFEIWGREKFLLREQGKRILKHCGLDMEFLNIYGTTEPLAYYSHTRSTPQNLLILENKDTFYSMRRHLLGGGATLHGVGIGTLIYGAGKGIIRSFRDFDLCVEPYMKEAGNQIYYFGDLDYEGIGIYESLADMFWDRWEIAPFVPAYLAMLEKAATAKRLPETKEQQNRNLSGLFYSYFTKKLVGDMEGILKCEKYIPQEILNITDF